MANDPLFRAVDAAGGAAVFLTKMSISPRTFYDWRKRGVPDTRWADVAAASGGAVFSSELAAQRDRLLGNVSAPAGGPRALAGGGR